MSFHYYFLNHGMIFNLSRIVEHALLDVQILEANNSQWATMQHYTTHCKADEAWSGKSPACPGLAITDYWLFSSMQHHLGGPHFTICTDIKDPPSGISRTQTFTIWRQDIHDHLASCQRSASVRGGYVISRGSLLLFRQSITKYSVIQLSNNICTNLTVINSSELINPNKDRKNMPSRGED